MTTQASTQAKLHALTALSSIQTFESFVAPHVDKWLEIEIIHNRLEPEDILKKFTLTAFDEKEEALTLQSEDEYVYLGYSEYEMRYGNSISIPLDFFDDPEKYLAEAQEAKATREKAEIQRQIAAKREMITRLERQLAKTKAEAGLDNTQTTQ